MKHFFLATMLLLGSMAAMAHNTKFQVEGPEKSYNMVRVTNQTHYTGLECTVYFLEEQDGKLVVSSSLGHFTLAGKDDTDSNRVRVSRGQWLGVSLSDEYEGVNVLMTYKDMPLFDIIQIVLTEGSDPAIGQEF